MHTVFNLSRSLKIERLKLKTVKMIMTKLFWSDSSDVLQHPVVTAGNLLQKHICLWTLCKSLYVQVSRSVTDYNFSAQFTFGEEQIASFYPCNPVSKHLSLVQRLLSLLFPPIYLMSLVTKTSKLRVKYYTHQTIKFIFLIKIFILFQS